MRGKRLIGVAIIAATIPTAAFADDPRDPSMRSADAHARDSEQTRQLNLQAAAANRGPRYHVVRPGGYEDADYVAASRDHDRDMDRYAAPSRPAAQDITTPATIEAREGATAVTRLSPRR